MKAKRIVVSILFLLISGLLGVIYQMDIQAALTDISQSVEIVSDAEVAEKDTYCLPFPGASNDEAITVIKTGENLVFTGNQQDGYSEVESPRYVPTCWIQTN